MFPLVFFLFVIINEWFLLRRLQPHNLIYLKNFFLACDASKNSTSHSENVEQLLIHVCKQHFEVC